MKSAGLTIVELMFGVAIAAILLAFALPSYRNIVQNNQLIACSNKLVSAIQFAKSQAITSRRTIHVAAYPAAAIQPAFRVGEDANGNNSIDDGEELQEFNCSGDGLSVSPSPNVSFVSFSSIGFRDDGQGTVVFTTCNEAKNGKDLTLSTGGGLATADTASGGCP